MEHECPIRVYYEDTDAGGIVYYANYLKFAERGRTEYLRNIGYENSRLSSDFGLIFVVRDLGAKYNLPCCLDDLLSMKTSVKLLRKTSFVMQQILYKDNKPAFEMDVTIVCVDSVSGKPSKLPEGLKEIINDNSK